MKFRKKPVIIDAVQWNPTEKGSQKNGWPKSHQKAKKFLVSALDLTLFIPTLEGTMQAKPGDWVVRGPFGEFYPVKPLIFEETYEIVKNSP